MRMDEMTGTRIGTHIGCDAVYMEDAHPHRIFCFSCGDFPIMGEKKDCPICHPELKMQRKLPEEPEKPDIDDILKNRIEWAKKNMGELFKADGYNAYLMALNHVHENYHKEVSGLMAAQNAPAPTDKPAEQRGD